MNRRDSEQRIRASHRRAGHFSARRLFPRTVTCLALIAIAFAGRARADELLAHGTAGMFWIARVVEPSGGAQEPVRTIVRGRGVGPDAQWSDVGQLASRATSVAHRGTQLAALLDTGAWMLLWPGGSAVGAQPPGEGARLLVLASNDESIFAIARAGKLRERIDEPNASTAPATEPAAQSPHPERLVLLRLDRGQWTHVAPLASQVSEADLARASFAVIGRVPTIAVLRFGGGVETFAYRADDATWDAAAPLAAPDATPEALPDASPDAAPDASPDAAPDASPDASPDAAPDAARIKLLSGEGERPILWIAPDGGAGRLHLAEQRAWGPPRVLRTPEQLERGAPRTVAWAGGSVRLLFIRDGKTFEQAFDENGEPRTGAAPLRMPSSSTTDSLPGRVITLAAAAMLLMVVLSGMRRANAGAGAEGDERAPPTPRVVPAPLLPRLLAGLIDAAPLAAACWVIFRNLDPNTQTVDDMLRRTSQPFYFALAGYLLYTWLAELIFARTIGKALLGLRVASLDGSRPGAVATFARNALRLVDVTMLGLPLLLVALSPLRQRVGDIAARTTVVSSRSSPEGRGPSKPDRASPQ